MEALQETRLEQHEIIKNRIKQSISQVCANYISIAYDLKEVSTKKLYIDAGYSGMGKYALSEFGISEDKCSWLIKVAERFCLPEQAELMPQYKDFGISVLREMLPLSDEKLEEIDPSTTVAQIRSMKKEAKEELRENSIVEQYGPIDDLSNELLLSIVNQISDKLINAYEDYFLDDPEDTFKADNFINWLNEELVDLGEIYINDIGYYLIIDNNITLINTLEDMPVCRVSLEYIANVINAKMNDILKKQEEIFEKLNVANSEVDEFATTQDCKEADDCQEERIPSHDEELDNIKYEIEHVVGEVVTDAPYVIENECVVIPSGIADISVDEMVKYSVSNQEILIKLVDAIKRNTSELAIKKVRDIMLACGKSSNFAGEWNFSSFSGFTYTIKGKEKQCISWGKYIEYLKSEFENRFNQEEENPIISIREECIFDKSADCNIHNAKEVAKSLEIDCKLNCCMSCEESCGARCNHSAHEGIQEEHNKELDLEDEINENLITKIENPENYDIDDVSNLLRVSEGRMEDCRKTNITSSIRQKLSIEIDALNLLKINMASSNVNEVELVQQPELLILKNNDQRKEFIDNYTSWPIWIEQELTGERYYKYDLTDKVSIVVKVSRKHIWENYKQSDKIDFSNEEYYLHGVLTQYGVKGNQFKEDSTRTFAECSCNKSTLIDYLKECQKKQR